MSLSIKVDHKNESVIFAFSGKIQTSEETIEAMDTLEQEISKEKRMFLYDLSHLEYITSSGLNFLVRSLTKIRNVGGEIVLCGVKGHVEKLLIISKLNEIFTIYPTITEGLNKFQVR
ncbi:MAG: STAS domain-containing protein [Flavobacteriia bacterium]|nr:STAS domain-containing protein [Flavobacteriia bacterium]